MADYPSDPEDIDPGGIAAPDEGAPLGVAATLSMGSSKDKAKAAKPKSGRKSPAGLIAGLVIVGVLALAIVPALLGGLAKTPRDKIGISYGGGPIEGFHFQKIVNPGSNLFFNGFYDSLYLYPADQRNYIIAPTTNAKGKAVNDAIVAPSKDRVQISFQVAMYFKLNTNLLRQFHEQLGLRYSAYTSSGWDKLIQDTFRQQVEGAIQEQTRRYDVADLYGNALRLVQIQSSVQRALANRLFNAVGAQFFCGPDFRPGGKCTQISFVIKRIDPPPNVVAAFEANRTSDITIQTKLNEVQQRKAEAESIDVLNRSLAASGDKYVLLKAIESGQISFWVLPSNSGLTLQTPAGLTPGGNSATAPTTPSPSSDGSGSTGPTTTVAR